MPQGYSRQNNQRDDDRDTYRSNPPRNRDRFSGRDPDRLGQYSRDDDMERGYGQEYDWDQRNAQSSDDGDRYFRNREDYSRNRLGGSGRGQQWGGGYNEGGYDQGGTWGYGARNWRQGQGGGPYGQSYGQGWPQTRYGANREYPYSGQGGGGAYGHYGDYDQPYRDRDDSDYQRRLNQQGRGRFDDDYMSWRDEQVRKLDDDYEAYRQEKQTKFNSDFETWRTKRSGETKSANEPKTTKQ